MPKSMQRAFLVALVSLAFCVPSKGETLVVVVHPATGVAPDEMVIERKDGKAFGALTSAKPQVVMGKSAGDAPGGRGFIIEVEAPKTVTVPKVVIGAKNKLSYKELVVVAPFALWHRSGAGAEPDLLGRAFVWGQEAPVNVTSNGNVFTYTLTGETPAELIEKAVRKNALAIPGLIEHAIAEKLIPSPAKASYTIDSLFAWARKIPATPQSALVVSPNGQFKIDESRLQKPHPGSSALRLTFRPTRAVKSADGSVVVEVEMWNRLPVRAFGMLRRDGSKAESALEDRLRDRLRDERAKAPDPIEWARTVGSLAGAALTKSHGSRFDLAPGEKSVAQFHIPKGLTTDPTLFRDNDITVVLSALGDLAAARSKELTKKGKKK